MVISGICLFVLFLISLLLIITRKYKLRYRNKLKAKVDKDEHPFLRFYGMAFFIIDKFLSKRAWYAVNKNDNKLKKIYVKEDIKEYRYLHMAKKITSCIVILAGVMAIGCGLEIKEYSSNEKSVQAVSRKNYGEGETEYSLIAESSDGKSEKVNISLQEKSMTIEECYEELNKAKPKILKKMLGENEDVNNISRPLNFISSYGERNIQIQWEVEESDLVDYEGNIIREVKEGGEVVRVKASLTLNKVSIEYTIPLCITAKESLLSLEEYLQRKVDEDEYSKEIELPKEINGNSVNYYMQREKSAEQIIFVGLVMVVAVFFLLDKNLDKDVEKRNKQMLVDYPEIVSKILLYNGAGMSIRNTLERIVKEYKDNREDTFRYAYEELEFTINKMNSGINEQQAISEYGKRSGIHCYIKLANILQQNLKRGTKEISQALQAEMNNAFFERKNKALKEGEEAGTKLLGPMVLMLIIAMAIVVAPALMSIKVQ